MAGTIPLSMTQQFDPLGNPLSGGKLYGIIAGTVSTPQNYFQDLALTLPWPNPITLDVAGRVPQLFIADGLIKIRLTDSTGVVQLSADNIQVIGASSGGGGGGAIDATTVAQTGDIKKRYGLGSHTGWVRCNANTIGSSISGATERANADAQALFQYLWGIDANLVVSGGRGGTSLADWNANKQIALPDGRGITFAGMDDMGGVAANRLTATYFGANATVLGARGGAQSVTLTSLQVPATTFTNALSGNSIDDLNHAHYNDYGVSDNSNNSAISGGSGIIRSGQLRVTRTAVETGYNLSIHRHFVSGAIDGGGQPHSSVQPTMVITFYIKL